MGAVRPSWPAAGDGDRGLVLRSLAGQLGEFSLDLAPDPADRDAEDALATGEKVDDLLCGGALVHGGTIAHQGDLGKVVDAAFTQDMNGPADLLQRDAGVEQALDDLERQDVGPR